MREEAEAVVEELQTRPRTGTARRVGGGFDEVQETLAERVRTTLPRRLGCQRWLVRRSR